MRTKRGGSFPPPDEEDDAEKEAARAGLRLTTDVCGTRFERLLLVKLPPPLLALPNACAPVLGAEAWPVHPQ
jgi:hypothetical protein